MKKYLLVMENTWNEVFTYRLNFFIWRFRSLISLLPIYFIWLTILSTKPNLFGYSTSMMLTYILGTAFVNAIVFSSRTYAIGDDINSGNLSNYLIKPMNFFLYYLSKDLGDKAMNIVFSIAEIALVIIAFRPPLFIQDNIALIILSMSTIFISLALYFLFNLLIGFIGFWSPEIWAPRFVFTIVVSFFAGSFFPLDILPKGIFNILSLTPFPYILYFPIKIYLGNIETFEIVRGVGISIIWVFLLYIFAFATWKKGLRMYTAQGR